MKFLDSVTSFIGNLISTVVVGETILLIAGEIRLAAQRKASQGSVRHSSFTESMTGKKLRLK